MVGKAQGEESRGDWNVNIRINQVPKNIGQFYFCDWASESPLMRSGEKK